MLAPSTDPLPAPIYRRWRHIMRTMHQNVIVMLKPHKQIMILTIARPLALWFPRKPEHLHRILLVLSSLLVGSLTLSSVATTSSCSNIFSSEDSILMILLNRWMLECIAVQAREVRWWINLELQEWCCLILLLCCCDWWTVIHYEEQIFREGVIMIFMV